MSRRYSGPYSAKHTPSTIVDQAVLRAVTSNMRHKKITCKAAFEIVDTLSVAPSNVGTAIDLLEGKITACQLGLFGYGKNNPLTKSRQQFDDAIKKEIYSILKETRLSCENAWRIADKRSVPRLNIAKACESLGVRICRCQLGAF